MLEAKHISKTFGDRQVLVDVNLQVKQGDVVVILGPSGSGKTTFLSASLAICCASPFGTFLAITKPSKMFSMAVLLANKL